MCGILKSANLKLLAAQIHNFLSINR